MDTRTENSLLERLGEALTTHTKIFGIFGAALIGLATRAALPRPAGAAPYPCGGFTTCSCCNTSGNCCDQYCDQGDTCVEGDGHCWYTCVPDQFGHGHLFRCCDFFSPVSGGCICSVYLGSC